MKSLSLSVAALCVAVGLGVCASFGDAQTFKYHPDSNPNTGNGNTFPFGNGFGADWRYQLFIPQASLGNAPLRITDIAFAPSTSDTFSAMQCQVRMAHTTLTGLSSMFAANLGGCPTQVFDGPMLYAVTAGAWHELGLQCDFGYDGVRNLVVEIRYRGRTAPNTSQFVFRTGTARLHANNITMPSTLDPYNAVAGQLDSTRGLKARFTCDPTCVALAQSDRVRVGSAITTQLVNGPAGGLFQFACALAEGPPIILGSNARLCLATDGLFNLSLQGAPFFRNFSGQLPASGGTAATTLVPSIPQLAGVCIYHAAAVVVGGQLACCTNNAAVELIP